MHEGITTSLPSCFCFDRLAFTIYFWLVCLFLTLLTELDVAVFWADTCFLWFCSAFWPDCLLLLWFDLPKLLFSLLLPLFTCVVSRFDWLSWWDIFPWALRWHAMDSPSLKPEPVCWILRDVAVLPPFPEFLLLPFWCLTCLSFTCEPSLGLTD